MSTEYLKVICDIIQKQMGLSADEIWIYNQKRDIPNDEGLYVVVGEVGHTVIGSKTSYENTAQGLDEVQTINLLSSIDINIFSSTSEARITNSEVIMALNSTYSQQMQEKNSISIGRISTSFTNTGELEETALMNRFTINMNVTHMIQKRKAVDYFDTFDKNVTPEA